MTYVPRKPTEFSDEQKEAMDVMSEVFINLFVEHDMAFKRFQEAFKDAPRNEDILWNVAFYIARKVVRDERWTHDLSEEDAARAIYVGMISKAFGGDNK